MKLSIVTTMYHSASHLEEFYTRVSAEAKKLTEDFEIIFVNDGSPDASLEIAVSLFEKDEKVRVIDLSKNFGHHRAIMTGLAHARGKLVFLLDCDLEEDPELLDKFHRELKSSGADVVYGVQERRKGGVFDRISGSIFYWLINLLSNDHIPANVITARLMSQRYVAALVEHKDREIFLVGLWVITGFKQVPLLVKKHDKSKTTYNFTRKITNFVNALTSFSNVPLVITFYLGCVILFISSIAAFRLVVRKLLYGSLLVGWPSLIISIWFLGGLTIFCLGLIGIYISKIFVEIKRRPYTVIRKHYER
ncbi:MAG: glycosyltransferase family 2 protein [Thermodesulfobacteriota bacterium]